MFTFLVIFSLVWICIHFFEVLLTVGLSFSPYGHNGKRDVECLHSDSVNFCLYKKKIVM